MKTPAPKPAASDPASEDQTAQTPAAEETPSASKRWESVVVVARGDVPKTSGRAVVYVQSTERQPADSSPKGEADYGSYRNPSQAPLKPATYQKGADVYFAVDPDVDFGNIDGEVVRVGVGEAVQQAGFDGFADRLGAVNVGPGNPVYAAANYAYTRGARKIEIVGLTQDEIAGLKPWLDTAPEDAGITIGG